MELEFKLCENTQKCRYGALLLDFVHSPHTLETIYSDDPKYLDGYGIGYAYWPIPVPGYRQICPSGLSTCKTASGSRRYEWKPMPSRLYTTLLHYREKCSGKGYVFRNKNNGEKYESRNQFIRYLCKRAKVKPFNYHGIRGLCATLLAANNVPMKQIQSVLMHSNMTTTDRYVRSIGGVSDELVMAFERFGDGAAACNVAIEAAN